MKPIIIVAEICVQTVGFYLKSIVYWSNFKFISLVFDSGSDYHDTVQNWADLRLNMTVQNKSTVMSFRNCEIVSFERLLVSSGICIHDKAYPKIGVTNFPS